MVKTMDPFPNEWLPVKRCAKVQGLRLTYMIILFIIYTVHITYSDVQIWEWVSSGETDPVFFWDNILKDM